MFAGGKRSRVRVWFQGSSGFGGDFNARIPCYGKGMKEEGNDPEGGLARLSQEATNQSTPDKALTDRKVRRAKRMKVAPRRSKAPVAD
jgi:hypothetical protein